VKLLEFEKPLADIYEKIDTLKKISADPKQVHALENEADKLKAELFANLTPFQIVQIARHPQRPSTRGLIQLICSEFEELHGDRSFRDDPAIVGGIGKLADRYVMIIGHQKGTDTKDNIYRNFGMPNPEGYRKALRLMKMAEKFNLPIVTFVDTPGAYPGIGAEERGQAEAIATNLKEMIALQVPIVSIVLGEGGSGGALGIAVANRIYMLQYAIYSVISPEGCASILFRDAGKAELAAQYLKLTATDIVKLGLADGMIPEPIGGAHRDWQNTANTISKVIEKDLKTLDRISGMDLAEQRYQKFRNFGTFISS